MAREGIRCRKPGAATLRIAGGTSTSPWRSDSSNRRHPAACILHDVRWIHRPPSMHVVDRMECLLALARGLRVIHLGFGGSEGCREAAEPQGLWLHARLQAVARELVGIDIDPAAVEEVRRQGYEAYIADCRDIESIRSVGIPPAELVVAGEIIEHVDAGGPFADALHQLVAPDGRLVITTPNAYAAYSWFGSLARREIINDDHVVLYSWYTLSNLLERHGWRIENFNTYRYPSSASSLGGKVVFGAQNALSAISPLVAHGLIAICQPA